MDGEFLGAETETANPVAKPGRKRGPMSEAQRAKIKASHAARKEKLKTETVPDVKTGASAEDVDQIRQEIKLKEIEDRIKAEALSDKSKLMVHQEIQVDSFNRLRRYVELTPSMCRTRNCAFDAAREAGATDWNNAPVDQVSGDGRTIGERLIALRDYHEATAHTIQQLNDHIITAGELEKRQWGAGQSIKNEFLQGAK